MSYRLHERIRAALDATPGLTQKGLAAAMGLNPAAVNRMLYGQRHIRAEEIPVIEEYLGARLTLSPFDAEAAAPRRGFSDVRQSALFPDAAMTPVYAAPLADKKILDWVPRHPMTFGLADAFAFYVQDDAMAPRYFRGELVYIHPHRPPEAGRDVLIERLDTGDVFLRRLEALQENNIHVRAFSAAEALKEIPRAQIRALYIVIGRG